MSDTYLLRDRYLWSVAARVPDTCLHRGIYLWQPAYLTHTSIQTETCGLWHPVCLTHTSIETAQPASLFLTVSAHMSILNDTVSNLPSYVSVYFHKDRDLRQPACLTHTSIESETCGLWQPTCLRIPPYRQRPVATRVSYTYIHRERGHAALRR